MDPVTAVALIQAGSALAGMLIQGGIAYQELVQRAERGEPITFEDLERFVGSIEAKAAEIRALAPPPPQPPTA